MTTELPAAGVLARAVAQAVSADGPIARSHDGFVARAGQCELACAIADAIEGGSTLVAEAGTGTGKTFAYLVPALLSGARVLISTGTRNLQDQLFDRDLPQVIRALDVRAEVALLKGRSNYVCRHHLRRNLSAGRFARREDIADLRRIDRFAAVTASGDRSALPGVAEDAPAWALATSTRENCLGQDCDDYDRCFVFKARQAAQRAEIIVVNHHLLCADLALRDEGIADLLPTTDALIFDEAHQLPDIATQFFGNSVSTRKLIDFSRDCLRAGLAEAADAADWTGLGHAIEQSVRELRLSAGSPGRLDTQAARARAGMLDSIAGCVVALGAARAVLEGAAGRGREVERMAVRATELVTQLERWLRGATPAESQQAQAESAAAWSEDVDAVARPEQADAATRDTAQVAPAAEPAETVVWAEVHAAGVTLNSTPLTVAHAFGKHIGARPRGWVFLSATLAVGGEFEHFASAMGIEQARRLVWHSPFDFAANGLLYVPQGIGEPSGPDFPDRVFAACWPLVRANEGRAFVLCTTLRMVDRLAALVRAAIEAQAPEFELLVQGSASRAELLERFRQHRAPVLIGSASFWEGVDVPGRQLSLVVIDKLPFAPPDEPVLRARIAAARRAGLDPFRTMQLPAAAMSLKQGAGRLIRSESDRGLLVVCDSRLAERGYGRILLKSLPPFRRTRSLDDALAFVHDSERAHAD